MAPHRLFRISGVVTASIIRRLNRFLLEVEMGGARVVVHTNNTGRLTGYIVKGRLCYCVRRDKPGRTSYRLLAVEEGGLGAIVDIITQLSAFEEGLKRGLIPWLRRCHVASRNVRLGASVIDLLIECADSELVYVEVKSAVMRGDREYAMYPDCPSKRGRRHIRELIEHVRGGGRGILLFISALPHVKMFKPNKHGDPEIYRLLVDAVRAGVDLRSISIYYDPADSCVYLDDPDLPVIIG